MKQTNNAIKFLMAQYRAIFKNANLKMFLAAATAAAAMAAGSAQAAKITDWTKLTTQSIDGSSEEKQLAIAGKDTVTNDKKFELTITAGDMHTIKGAAGAATFKATDDSTLTLNGADAKLVIGDAASDNVNASVTIGAVTNTQGTLEIAGKAAAQKSSLSATTITIGGENTAASKAAVNVNAFGSLNATGTGDGEGLIITKGAKITVVENASATGKITMNDGSVILSGSDATAALGSASSAITLTGGTVEAASTKSGSVIGSSIVLSGGTVDAKGALTIQAAGDAAKFEAQSGTIKIGNGGALTLKGVSDISGAKITNDSGKLIIDGTATLADGSLDVSAKSGSTILHGKNANDTSTLKVSSTELAKVMSGGLAASGNGVGVLEITGSGEVNLASTGDGATSILTAADGKFNAKLTLQDNAKLKIKGTTGSFTAFDTINAENKKISLSFETLTVGSGDTVTLESGAGLEVSKLLTVGKGEASSTLKVVNGELTLNGTSGDVKAKAINLEGGNADEAKFTIASGSWNVNDLTLTKSGAATVKGQMKVGGTLSALGADSTLTVSGGLVDVQGAGTINFKAAGDNKFDLSKGAGFKLDGDDLLTEAKALNTDKLKATALKGDTTSYVDIDLKGEKLTADQFSTLKGALTNFKGIYKVSVDTGIEPGKNITLTDLAKFPQLETDAFNESTLELKNTDTINQNYSIGNILMTEGGDLSLADGGAFTLNTPKDGLFVGKKSGDGYVAANVAFSGTATNSLTLVGTGEIGSISTKDATSKGTLVVGVADKNPKAGHVTVVGGGIGAAGAVLGEVALNDGSSLTVKSGDVFADNLTLGAGTSLDVNGDVSVDTAAVLGADINVKNFSIKQTTPSFANDAVFSIDAGTMRVTDKLALGQNNLVTVGTAATFDEGVETAPGSSAQVFAGTLEIKNGSVLFVDPSFKSAPSFVVGQTITDGTTPGNLAGSIAIGANSAVGFGFTETEFNDVMSKHLVDGKFVATDGYANAVVIGTPITVAAGSYIDVDQTLTKDKLSSLTPNATDSTVHLGAGAALVVTKDAFDPTNGAIKLAGTTNKVTADAGSTIVLEGGVTLADKDLTLFTGANTIDSKAEIAAAGGLISGTLDTAGKLTLAANNKKLDAIRSVVSSPVVDLLVDYRDGDFHGASDAGLDFIESMLNKDNFVAIDAAAHAATYAGAQQAAVAAVGTMAEAVGGRVGSMGVEAATIAATGSQVTGGVWLSPMYKSVDADGFNAQGASYGSDIDLAGVAFGADTVDGNTRYGVVFNIGSGEAEGKGNGNGLKDDFDYYGIGLYSVRASNNFAVVADASYNVISHDVEGLGAKGSAETVALTAGLTGQYTMSSPMVDVTPHLGARFIRLDTDSYDLVAGGDVVAETDFDVQNVFSVPLGVTLSKAFEMGGWSLAPSADLSITFNTGDTDVESNTYFTGTKNYGFTTEVLDEVTYGIAVGLGAQYGAFGTNIGLNYTGSENTDSFGVNAQARYMF